MSLTKSPYIHAIFISVFTLFYATLFIFTANHMELNSMLSNETLSSSFWNGWSNFIEAGNMKYIAYLMGFLTVCIIATMMLKKCKYYDEYQVSVLVRLMIVAGVVSMVMLPIMLFMLLSDRNYFVETLFLFVTVQWLAVLVSNLVYTIKYS